MFQALGVLEDAQIMESTARLFEYRASIKRGEGLQLIRFALSGSEGENFFTRLAALLEAPRLVVGREVTDNTFLPFISLRTLIHNLCHLKSPPFLFSRKRITGGDYNKTGVNPGNLV